MERLVSALGIIVILLIAWSWSSDRKNLPVRPLLWGLTLQLLLALFVLKTSFGGELFHALGNAVTWFLSFASDGAAFLFGKIAGAPPDSVFGMQFALTVVSIMVFFSAVTSVLYHYGVIQRVVNVMAWVMRRTMQTTAIESLSAAANVFLGQTEAPLVIRHYLNKATVSELFAIMVGGFASIAGSILGVYIGMGIPADYLIIATILAAPGGLALAKLAEPMKKDQSVRSNVEIEEPKLPSRNALDAVSRGAMDGFKIAVNVIVVLLAFKAIVALLDASLAWSSEQLAANGVGWVPSSVDGVLGVLFYPFAWLTGVPAHEVQTFAQLLGTKISQTEFLAYEKLARLIESGALSERTVMIATVGLCGFANVMSIGIQIGGFGIMAPDRRSDVARLGFKAMCIGALANLLAACIVGLLA